MSLTNPKKVITEERLAEFYQAILPYLGGIEVDNVLSSSSENPVQNKIITGALDNKIGKVSGAINGHLAGLDNNGNLTDSGVVASNVIEKVTTATQNNLVSLTSSGNIADSGVSKSVLSSKTESSGGTDLSLVTTGEKYIWNRKVSDNPTFTQATSRANIASGESFSTLFGKIMKWFADLKDLAFISKPTSGQTTTWLRGDGTWVAPPNDNTWTAMVGATSSANGTAGYVGVNPPSNGYNTKYWRADGTWTVPPDTTYGVVSKTANGLAPQLPNETTTTKYLRQDGTWTVPPNNNTISSAYCDTAAATAAKTASCTGYNLTSNTYLHVIIVNANSSANALTLNVNGKGAKSIYINGSASSSSNYSLPAGSYLVYYDGTNYYFRTDGALTTKGTYNINPSYGSYNINSQMPSVRRLTRTVSAGSSSIGTWDDSATPTETDWWQSDYFKFPASANSKNIDISFKFDPEYGGGEIVVIGGYILDTTTGKLCIKFGKEFTNAQLVAVDITYTPTYS